MTTIYYVDFYKEDGGDGLTPETAASNFGALPTIQRTGPYEIRVAASTVPTVLPVNSTWSNTSRRVDLDPVAAAALPYKVLVGADVADSGITVEMGLARSAMISTSTTYTIVAGSASLVWQIYNADFGTTGGEDAVRIVFPADVDLSGMKYLEADFAFSTSRATATGRPVLQLYADGAGLTPIGGPMLSNYAQQNIVQPSSGSVRSLAVMSFQLPEGVDLSAVRSIGWQYEGKPISSASGNGYDTLISLVAYESDSHAHTISAGTLIRPQGGTDWHPILAFNADSSILVGSASISGGVVPDTDAPPFVGSGTFPLEIWNPVMRDRNVPTARRTIPVTGSITAAFDFTGKISGGWNPEFTEQVGDTLIAQHSTSGSNAISIAASGQSRWDISGCSFAGWVGGVFPSSARLGKVHIGDIVNCGFGSPVLGSVSLMYEGVRVDRMSYCGNQNLVASGNPDISAAAYFSVGRLANNLPHHTTATNVSYRTAPSFIQSLTSPNSGVSPAGLLYVQIDELLTAYGGVEITQGSVVLLGTDMSKVGGDALLAGGTVIAEGVTFPPGFTPKFSATRHMQSTLVLSNCPGLPDAVHTPFTSLTPSPGDTPGPGAKAFQIEATGTPSVYSRGAEGFKLGEVYGVKGVPIVVTIPAKQLTVGTRAEVSVGAITGSGDNVGVVPLAAEGEGVWTDIEINFNPPFTGKHPVIGRVWYQGLPETDKVLFSNPRTGA